MRWDAEAYDQVSGPQLRWGSTVLDRLELHGAETVLDAGCGSGRLTGLLARRVPAGVVIGLDAAATMAALARSQLGPEVLVVVADLGSGLPFAPATFDAVFSTATLHWVRDQSRLYQNFGYLLHTGGQLVAQCGGFGNVASVIEAIRAVGGEDLDPWAFATPETARGRLVANGFVDIEAWLHPEPTRFESIGDLATFLSTCVLNPWLDRLPAPKHAEFALAVAEQLPRREIDYVRLNLTARRG